MVSITHKDDEIVESKEFTPISSPKNTYDTNSDELNDTDEEELLGSGLQKRSLKQEITSMVSVTHKDDQIVESKEITPISSPKNTYDPNSDELNDTDEDEVNVCDTCGVQGFTNKLAICDNCGVGAEHNYCCMAVKLEDVPERWSCNDCMGESRFRKQNDLSTQKSSVTVGLDLNIEPNLNLNPNIDLNLDPSIDLNVNPKLDLNLGYEP
ncbi:unnamed protein product [Brassica rapa]|uniref:PHD-type domain-containing protein n=1 Tax=Brassica campestris TaxID=3711 RepID=A0A8D9G747_BRACM|nr:unnamed protein product [Brassica rapa]